MAAPRDPYFDLVEELFAPLGAVSIRRMFGGAGVYLHGVMFALIASGETYLKVDAALKADLEAEGSGPFVYEKKTGETAVMAYYRLPDTAADDPVEASHWGRRALDVALKAKAGQSRAAQSKAGQSKAGKAKATRKKAGQAKPAAGTRAKG